MQDYLEVRDVVRATGHGAITKHHEQLWCDDQVNGVLSVGDCALLAAEAYKPLQPLYLTNNTNAVNPHASAPIPAHKVGLSGWVCVKTWDFPGENDKFATILPNALLNTNLAKFNLDGFFAALFRTTRAGDPGYHYVLAFRGTEQPSCSDWINDAQQALGAFSLQYAHVAQIIGLWLTDFLERANTLTFTGHSLGGGLAAMAVSLIPHVPAITFNAAGLHHATLNEAIAYLRACGFDDAYKARHYPASLGRSNIRCNYHVMYEVLTTLQTDPALLLRLISRHLTRGVLEGLGAATAAVRANPVKSGLFGAVVVATDPEAAAAAVATGELAAQAGVAVSPVFVVQLARLAATLIAQGGLPSARDANFGDFPIPAIAGKSFVDLHLMAQVSVALGLHPKSELLTQLTWAAPDAEIDVQ